MAYVVHFFTGIFDVALERPNTFQELAGESLLLWLSDRMPPDVAVSFPEPEDWGWQSLVDWRGLRYVLGASARDEVNGELEWVLQIDRQRSVSDLMSGHSKLAAADGCVKFIQRLLERESSFEELTVETAA